MPPTRDELRQLTRQRPFQPFRIVVNDGRVYTVYPRMNLVADSFMKVGIPDAGDTRPEPSCDHSEFVWLKDIIRVEMIPATPTASS